MYVENDISQAMAKVQGADRPEQKARRTGPEKPPPEKPPPEMRPEVRKGPELEEVKKTEEARKAEEARKLEEARRNLQEETMISQMLNTGLTLEIEEELNIVIAKIIEKETGKVLKQIPLADLVEIAKTMKESGMLINKEA